MDSTDLVTPLAETIGVLWKEVEDAGKTKEALLQFKDRLKALRIFIGNCDCPFLGTVLCNHMASVGAYIDEHIEKKEKEAQSHAQTTELLSKTSAFLKG